MKKTIIIVAIGILGVFLSQTQAALIEIAITAEVTDVDDPGGILEGNVNVGDTITGYYKYDSATPDSSPNDPSVGRYWQYSSPYGISMNVGDLVFQTDPSSVQFMVLAVNNNSLGHDIYNVHSYKNHIIDEILHVESISFTLKDYSGQALATDNLPVSPPVLVDFNDENYLVIAGGREGGYGIGAYVTNAVLIPEPATFLLFVVSGLILKKRINSLRL